MTYQTNNPVGSVDVRDLYDNAENLDNFSNGPLDAYSDRFGVSRQSLQGIRNSSSFQILGPYAAGLEITSYNQAFSYMGDFYAPSAEIALPYTLTGVGASEIETFRLVGEATLRADLANAVDPALGADLVGFRNRTVREKLLEDDAITDGAPVNHVWGVDDTAVISAKIAGGGRFYVPDRVFAVANLLVPGGTELYGPGTFTIKAGSSASNPLLLNETIGSFTDSDIILDGITFDFDDATPTVPQDRFTPYVNFVRVTNLTVKNCKFKNGQYIGLAIGACVGVSVLGNEFTNLGYGGTLPLDASSNGGPAAWIANSSATQSENVVFSGNHSHDNNWHGLHINATGWVVSNNIISNNKEAGIFSPHAPGTGVLSYSGVISCNTIDGVTVKAISGSGIEMGGDGVSIIGNTIINTAHSGLSMMDVKNASVIGNTVRNFNQVTSSQGAGVFVISASASPDQPSAIRISANNIADDQAVVTGYAGISVIKSGAGVNAIDVRVTDNSLAPVAWLSGTPLIVTALGSNSVAYGNTGAVNFGTQTLQGLTVGDATGLRSLRISGGNTGSSDGAALYYQTGGVTIGATGNLSAILGGAYNPDATLWSAVGNVQLYSSANDVKIYARGAQRGFIGTGWAVGSTAVDPGVDGVLNVSSAFRVGDTKVVGAQETGWTAFGAAVTANKGAYNPAASYTVSAAYVQAEVSAIAAALVAANARIKALESAMRTHGLIN